MKLNQRNGWGFARRAGVLVAVGGLGVLAACGGGGSVAEGDGENHVSDLVVDVLAEPDSLDPLYRNTEEAQRYSRLVYSSILQWNEDGSVSPDLAAEMPEVSDDRATWTVKLRDGITFHDGSTLDAEDVVHTYEVILDPENGSPWLSGLAYLDSVKALDDHTVEFKLSEPFSYFESKLAMFPIISDEDKYVANDTYATSENGSGPYTMESLKRGDALKLTRYDDYFGEPLAFDTVTFKIIPEDASRIARLTNGESHIVPGLPTDQVDLVKERGANATTVDTNISRLFAYPSMNNDRPTSNVDFRLAIAYAIDRQKIVDQVFSGAGRPNATYLTYGSQNHDEEVGLAFGEKPDLAKAKEHLAASGIDLDRKLSIIAVKDPQVSSAATIIQSNLKELGIDSSVESQDMAGFYPALVSGDYDLILFDSPASTSSGFAPDYVFNGLYSTAASNVAKFEDPKIDELLTAAMIAPAEEQDAAWRAVQERDVETQGNIQIVVHQTSQGWSKQLGDDYEPSALLWLNTLRSIGAPK